MYSKFNTKIILSLHKISQGQIPRDPLIYSELSAELHTTITVVRYLLENRKEHIEALFIPTSTFGNLPAGREQFKWNIFYLAENKNLEILMKNEKKIN